MLFGERNKIIHQWFTCITCDVRRAWHHTSNGGNPWNLGQSVMRKHLVVVAYDFIGRLSVFMRFVSLGGWGGVWGGMITFVACVDMVDATQLWRLLDVHTWSILCHCQGGVGMLTSVARSKLIDSGRDCNPLLFSNLHKKVKTSQGSDVSPAVKRRGVSNTSGDQNLIPRSRLKPSWLAWHRVLRLRYLKLPGDL